MTRMKPSIAILAGSILALGAGAAPAAASTTTTLAPLHGYTAVSSFGSAQAWSDLDTVDQRWHVMVRDGGRISAPAAIPSAAHAIDVSVGPGVDRKPELAYVDCDAGCRVVVSRLDGSAAHRVPASANASVPTIWGTQVAWVRGATTIVASTVNGGGRRTLPGSPRRKCFQAPRPRAARVCQRPARPSVDALALHGRQLAFVDTFDLDDGIGANGTTTEVRTESVRGGAQRLVALMSVGEGDESWAGPSWAAGKLYFYQRSFGGDSFGVFGYDPAHGTYMRAGAATFLAGFAIADGGRRAYETTSPGPPDGGLNCGDANTKPCVLRISAPFAFKPVRSLAHSL